MQEHSSAARDRLRQPPSLNSLSTPVPVRVPAFSTASIAAWSYAAVIPGLALTTDHRLSG